MVVSRGVKYDADAAELMTALQGSIEGWTWRQEFVNDVTTG